jgi:hypothetical protein
VKIRWSDFEAIRQAHEREESNCRNFGTKTSMAHKHRGELIKMIQELQRPAISSLVRNVGRRISVRGTD